MSKVRTLLLSLTLKWAQEEALPLAVALARVTAEPARVLGLESGHLGPGADADVCVFDPQTVIESPQLRDVYLGSEL